MAENRNSKARIAANNRYNAKAYDRINIAVPKGVKAIAEARAKDNGETINAFMNRLLRVELGMSVEEWKYSRYTQSED